MVTVEKLGGGLNKGLHRYANFTLFILYNDVNFHYKGIRLLAYVTEVDSSGYLP